MRKFDIIFTEQNSIFKSKVKPNKMDSYYVLYSVSISH